jgi:hypothetical protein
MKIFERVARPTVADGRRAPALRFGDPRVMALVGALVIGVNVVTGFTNRSLRAQAVEIILSHTTLADRHGHHRWVQ